MKKLMTFVGTFVCMNAFCVNQAALDAMNRINYGQMFLNMLLPVGFIVFLGLLIRYLGWFGICMAVVIVTFLPYMLLFFA